MQIKVNQRLKILVDTLWGGNKTRFINEFDISRGGLYDLYDGKSTPKLELIDAICNAYGFVNTNFICKGEMPVMLMHNEYLQLAEPNGLLLEPTIDVEPKLIITTDADCEKRNKALQDVIVVLNAEINRLKKQLNKK